VLTPPTLQHPITDAALNQLLSLGFGETVGHEDVLWQGELNGLCPTCYCPQHVIATRND
jgi:hypothetical protein